MSASGVGSHRGLGPQLPLALRYPPDLRLDSFVGPDAGTVAALRGFARGDAMPSPALPLFLLGASGSGKTHLALGVCAEAEAAGRRAAYLALPQIAGRVRDALEGLDACTLLALDGLDAIAGNHDDEIALFQLHNRARATNASLLYTARVDADALPLALPDLRSRLQQCTRLALHALDDTGRAAVLRERAQRRGLILEDAAIDWMLTRTNRDLGALVGLLDRLDAASLAEQRRVTVPFLRKVLA